MSCAIRLPSGAVEPLVGEAHVWWVGEGDTSAPHVIEALERFLLPEEEKRARSFLFARHRLQYLLTRALARVGPSMYAEVPPEAWRFERNEFGKPEIVDSPVPLEINLCNTDGLVACALTAGPDVGVDAEDTTRPWNDTMDLAERYFSAPEMKDLRALEPDRRRARFYQLWTLKEAYVKARGLGLSLPLRDFSFRFGPSDEIQLSVASTLGEEPSAWQFHMEELPSRHQLGLAVRHGSAPRLRVRVRRLPLAAMVT